MPELLEELDLLNTVQFSGRYGRVTSELTKKQKKFFAAFDVNLQTYV